MGLTFVDSVILIDLLDGDPAFQRLARQACARSEPLWASELVSLESLVVPLRKSEWHVAQFESLFRHINLVPIDGEILRKAAELRAWVPGLKTPDAIHAATALLNDAELFITRDPGFGRVPDLRVELLKLS